MEASVEKACRCASQSQLLKEHTGRTPLGQYRLCCAPLWVLPCSSNQTLTLNNSLGEIIHRSMQLRMPIRRHGHGHPRVGQCTCCSGSLGRAGLRSSVGGGHPP